MKKIFPTPSLPGKDAERRLSGNQEDQRWPDGLVGKGCKELNLDHPRAHLKTAILKLWVPAKVTSLPEPQSSHPYNGDKHSTYSTGL